MTLYRSEITEVEIHDFEGTLAAKVTCFDDECSEVKVSEQPHNVESWRELSAKIEEALRQIHPAK